MKELMNKKTQEIVSAIKGVVAALWTAGFLFTLGFCGGFGATFSTLGWFQKIVSIILVYILWPLALGIELHK
ncbi:MAG: hypothetical protein WA061_01940 [Microgenomates group bacterium]